MNIGNFEIKTLSKQTHRLASSVGRRENQAMPRARKAVSPFRYFNSSPEIIRFVVMMYVRYPLSLRNMEDLLFERGIDICHETVRLWWNRSVCTPDEVCGARSKVNFERLAASFDTRRFLSTVRRPSLAVVKLSSRAASTASSIPLSDRHIRYDGEAGADHEYDKFPCIR